MVGDSSNITLSTAYPRQNGHDALSWDWIYIELFIRNIEFIQSFKPCFSLKNRDFATEWWHFYMFLAAFYCKKQRCCNRMMKFPYVFGGILCGLHKVHKTPRIPSILKIWGSNVWHAASWTFWPEAFYVWHSISYYPVKSHKISYERFITKKSSSNSR